MTSPLLAGLFACPDLVEALSDRARLQGMLDFEAALARAEARLGIIPAEAAPAIVRQCRAELFDREDLAAGATRAGNLAIPLVKRLTALVKAEDEPASRYVHWGATSQDPTDSGLVLQLRTALAILDADLDRLLRALATLAEQHAGTVMIGRTWLQHAVPVTFGLKAAGWLSMALRCRDRLRLERDGGLVLQFGGAAGTLASLGDRGLDIGVALAEELGLALPDLPWHAARDRLAGIATALGILAGALGKIARDLSLMGQTEIAEANEPAGEGRGGSSTMPHKRNPVGCAVALAAAIRVPGLVSTMLSAMPQEHERGLGGWHAEWDTLPEILLLSGGSLRTLAQALEGLEVDGARMRADIDATDGLVMAEALTMALGDRIGRGEAHKLVEAASRRAVAEQISLRAAVAADGALMAHLDEAALDRLFDPSRYLGVADQLVARALKEFRCRP